MEILQSTLVYSTQHLFDEFCEKTGQKLLCFSGILIFTKYCIFFYLQNLETLQSNINTNIFGHILWKPKPKNSIDTSDSRKN